MGILIKRGDKRKQFLLYEKFERCFPEIMQDTSYFYDDSEFYILYVNRVPAAISCHLIGRKRDFTFADIYNFAVLPEFRGQGLSEVLLRHHIKLLEDGSYRYYVIQTIEDNYPMLHLLRKLKKEGLFKSEKKLMRPHDYYGNGKLLYFIQFKSGSFPISKI